MKSRIIVRIILGLVILLGLVLLVTKVFIPLFDTSDEAATYVPDIQRYADTGETFTLESDTLTFTLDPETTHFTVTDKRTGKTWSSIAPGVESDSETLLEEKNRLQSVLTMVYMNKAGKDTTWSSYQRSVANRLYSIEYLEEDAIMVTYTIGDIARDYLYPEAITDEYMQILLENADSKTARSIKDAYQQKGVDPATGKSYYKKADDIAALEAQYPDLKDGVVWIVRKAKSEQRDNAATKIEQAMAAAGYTAEDYARDEARVVREGETEGATDKPIFNISVIYRIQDADLVVEVPMDRITYNPNYPITTLNLLPAFGSAGKTESGFIFVPEGTGAIIHFNNGKVKQSAYTASLYGHDYAIIRTEVINETRAAFPVFGMATQGSSFLCILEDGKSWAGVTANTAGQPSYGSYNAANAFYTIIHGNNYDVSERTNNKVYMFEQELPEGSIVQRYRFIDSDDYMTMAGVYRDYLLAANPQMNRTVSSEAHTVIELVGAIDKVQQVLGVPTNVPIALTTYEQASELTQKLISEDLPNLSIRYAGWMNGGLNQSILNKIRLMSEMGSVKELKAFTKLASDAGIPLYLDGLTCFARDSGLMEGFIVMRDAARHTTREEAEIPEYSPIWYGEQDWRENYYLLKPALIMKGVDVLSEAATEYGATGVSFRDVGNLLSGDYDPKDFVTREEARLEQMEKLSTLRDAGQLVMTRSGNDYAAVYSDIVTDMDLEGTPYQVIDQFVPFYPAALHGSVPYTGVSINLAKDREELLLRSAEMGASLQFSLMASNVQELQDSWFSEYYGADASIIYDDMVATINTYNERLSGTFDQTMTDHRREGDVSVTEYENGVRVYVNYGYTDATVDGVLVPARDYLSVTADETAKEAIE